MLFKEITTPQLKTQDFFSSSAETDFFAFLLTPPDKQFLKFACSTK